MLALPHVDAYERQWLHDYKEALFAVKAHQESEAEQRSNFNAQRRASVAPDGDTITAVIDFGSKYVLGRQLDEGDQNYYQRGKASVVGVAVRIPPGKQTRPFERKRKPLLNGVRLRRSVCFSGLRRCGAKV